MGYWDDLVRDLEAEQLYRMVFNSRKRYPRTTDQLLQIMMNVAKEKRDYDPGI